jgi:hypothetical protein
MDFWRGETYMSFFEFLDQTGGFYYEVSFPLFPLPIISGTVIRKRVNTH